MFLESVYTHQLDGQEVFVVLLDPQLELLLGSLGHHGPLYVRASAEANLGGQAQPVAGALETAEPDLVAATEFTDDM